MVARFTATVLSLAALACSGLGAATGADGVASGAAAPPAGVSKPGTPAPVSPAAPPPAYPPAAAPPAAYPPAAASPPSYQQHNAPHAGSSSPLGYLGSIIADLFGGNRHGGYGGYGGSRTNNQKLCPDSIHYATNTQCCPWFAVRDELIENVFENVCGDHAHATIRIAFHDAVGWSINGGKGGGSDGSIIAHPIELTYAANAGIEDIIVELQPLADAHRVSYGDIIQFGASVALSMCPGAPVVQTYVGRSNVSYPAPDGTVPLADDDVSAIFARIIDAGLTTDELVALLASHSIAAQELVDPSIAGSPFDSTPGVMDSQMYLEVLLKGVLWPGASHLPVDGTVLSPMAGEIRLQSDWAIARSPVTACTWQKCAGNQTFMANKFAAAMAKLALLGQSAARLTDCTEVIPPAAPVTARIASLPPGKLISDIEASCPYAALAAFPQQPGVLTNILPVPRQS